VWAFLEGGGVLLVLGVGCLVGGGGGGGGPEVVEK
jgi:hypothetical protein